jgi:hypothetical protein
MCDTVAFDAMRRYLEAFCKPFGGDEELGYLLGAISSVWEDGRPNVLSEWEDYLAVLHGVRAASELSESRGFSGASIDDSSCRPGAEAGRHVEGTVA